MLTWLSVDEILLLRELILFSNVRGLPFKVEVAPSCLKHMNSVYLHSSRGQYRLLLAQDCAAEIRLGQGYFPRVLVRM